VKLLVRINNSSKNETSLDADFKGNFWQKNAFLWKESLNMNCWSMHRFCVKTSVLWEVLVLYFGIINSKVSILHGFIKIDV